MVDRVRISKVGLNIALVKKEMTKVELAKVTGIHRQQIHMYANGYECKPETAGKIAKALNVPVQDLLEN